MVQQNNGEDGKVATTYNFSFSGNYAMAIPVMNKNYLMTEIAMGGKKVLETKSISKEILVFSTAGYTIKEMDVKRY